MAKHKHLATDSDVALVSSIFATTPANTPIPSRELEERTGLTLRVLRDAMSRLVKSGMPIISNRDGGYLVSTDEQEVRAEMERLFAQAREIRLRGRGLETYLQRATPTAYSLDDHADDLGDLFEAAISLDQPNAF